MISASKTDGMEGWLTLNITKTITRQAILARTRNEDSVMEPILKYYGVPDTRGKNPNDSFLSGEVRGPKEAFLQLVRISLQVI